MFIKNVPLDMHVSDKALAFFCPKCGNVFSSQIFRKRKLIVYQAGSVAAYSRCVCGYNRAVSYPLLNSIFRKENHDCCTTGYQGDY